MVVPVELLMSSGRRWKFRVKHILDAMRKIEQYTAGMDMAQLGADSMVLDAVIRNSRSSGKHLAVFRSISRRPTQRSRALPWRECVM
jgi:uncharacterized protein with HEPN domain